jgi:hypothetical protein
MTTSSNILSERTLNLKKEITNLDEEIIQLQNSLHHAISKRTSGANLVGAPNLMMSASKNN